MLHLRVLYSAKHLVRSLLHCTLSLAVQCVVIGPVCVGRAGGRAMFVGGCVGGSVTTITRNLCASIFTKLGL